MPHLLKLAVGIRDLAHLRQHQTRQAAANPPLRHQTRNAPRRASEIVRVGSIYWVISGQLLARQRILAIEPGCWDDGTPCAALILDANLVAVEPRSVRPFQGWRYLETADAPMDYTAQLATAGLEPMPERLVLALRKLALL